MTTPVRIPFIILDTDGEQTTFDFDFGYVDHSDMYVVMDGAAAAEYSDYDLTTTDNGEGGTIEFLEAPAADSFVLIIRNTTYSQEVDYENFTSFPAETHEWNLDKITYILQELLTGALRSFDADGNEIWLTFDLSVTAGSATVTINNSGGTDAVIPSWVSGETAGVFHGEITESAPADESVTTKPDGYVWIEV